MTADPTDHWTPVGVVFENHPIEIDGVNPWKQSWQSSDEIAYVRHPSYPTQVHDVSVYVMQVEGRSIRFAAGELSNGVWGFYRPWPADTASPDWLLEQMTGAASPAKAAVGDKPVFEYIAMLPQPQRGIVEAIDALAARTLPDLQRSVKWGMAYYGVGDGWCFSAGAFVGHVKVMFVNGVTLDPVPPVTPIGMGKATRGVELASVDELDEAQVAAWMTQITAAPGFGGAKGKA